MFNFAIVGGVLWFSLASIATNKMLTAFEVL